MQTTWSVGGGSSCFILLSFAVGTSFRNGLSLELCQRALTSSLETLFGAAEGGAAALALEYMAFQSPSPHGDAASGLSGSASTTTASAVLRCPVRHEAKVCSAAAACTTWQDAPLHVTVVAVSRWLLPLCHPSLLAP